MADPVEHARGTANRATGARGASAGAGNPGTYLGTETIDGVAYARYRAEEGTWVSASMRDLGYDRQYGKDTAYGAYAGVTRSPDGSRLKSPDRIRPGQEYLIPVMKGDQASRISVEPGPPSSRAIGSPGPSSNPAPGTTQRAEGTEVALPGARARQRVVGDRATPQPGVAKPKDEEWQDQIVGDVLTRLIAKGILSANNAREIQQEHLDKVLGRIGVVSNWLNRVIPPYIGAWVNASNLLVRASGSLSNRNFEGAMIGVVNGYSALFEAQEDWNEYVRASIRGAERTTATLTSVRDTAVGVEVALATGNVAAPFVGVTGGFVVGTGFGVGAVSASDSQAGEAVRGTVEEIGRRGLFQNMLLAKQGLFGIAYGTGEGLSEIPGAFARLPEIADKLLRAAGGILATLFTDPAKLADDLVRFGEAVALIHEALSNRWDWLASLPPEKQGFEIGRLAGHIEAILVVLQVGRAGGTAAGDLVLDTLSGPTGEIADVAILQLVDIRAQLQVFGAAAGAVTAVAMAAPPTGGGASGGGGSGKSWWTDKKTVAGQLRPGQIAPYKKFKGTKGKLEGHEVLQNLWLEVRKVVERRGKGIASRDNPAIALPPKVHDAVDRFQRALGLFDRAKVAKLSYKQVLGLNALALKSAGVPQSIIREILEEALEHAVFSLARGY